MNRTKFLLFLYATLALAACGGGGGSSSNSSAVTPQVVTPPTLVLLAGSLHGDGSINGEGTNARLNAPSSLVRDSAGNIFVADTGNAVIRKITPSGVTSTYAGAPSIIGALDGARENARFFYPSGLAIDKNDNLYVSDTGNFLIRKITAAGVVSTIAGGPSANGGIVNGPGASARFKYPDALTVDSTGNIFVVDSDANNIRKITPTGMVSTFAGSNDGGQGSYDGIGENALFVLPRGITIDSADNIYVADTYNATIRKITPTGVVTTFAGQPRSKGSNDGPISSALFDYPRALSFDQSGNLFVADMRNNTIRKISPTGIVSTLAGTANTSGGSADGIGGAAQFRYPRGITSDSSNNLYISDSENSSIRKITPTGTVTTWIGRAATQGTTDGNGASASFSYPSGLVADKEGNFYIADTFNHTIRKISSMGVVSTIAGSARQGGFFNSIGTQAEFFYPSDLVIDSAGNLFVADQFNDRIRKIEPNGSVSTFAGGASTRGANGMGTMANFNYPGGITIDSANNLFVADTENHTIRKISAQGIVTTIAGYANGVTGSADGFGCYAKFNYPKDLVVDITGNIFVADQANHTIRKISPDGMVTTLAGKAGESGSTNGVGDAARFTFPASIALDVNGNLFVADSFNSTIRKITPSGTVTTIAGIAGIANLSLDPASKTLAFPRSIAFDNKGRLFAAMNHGVFQINF